MENQLARAFQILGHEVKMIASTISYIKGNLTYIQPGEYVEDGLSVRRLPFGWRDGNLAHKLWKMKGLRQELEYFQPDVIYHMNICGLEIKHSFQYVANNSKVSLFYDNHAAFYNSGKNWLSKYLRYRLFLGSIVREAAKHATNVFYIGNGEKIFLLENFRIPIDKLKLFPLGDFILPEDDYEENRTKIRVRYSVKDNQKIICHTGKLNKSKNTLGIISAYLESFSDNSQLWIIGSLDDDIREAVLKHVEKDSERIKYFGWKDSDELSTVLCACDIYVQLSVSSTFLTALCRKCIGISVNPNNTYSYIPDDVFFTVSGYNDWLFSFSKVN
nr:glycosyltransferase [uncultured Sphaerochaeta sp.]